MKRARVFATQAVLLGAALVLLWLALRDVSWLGVMAILRRVDPLRLVIIALLDLGIILCISARWWVLLRGFGHSLPYPSLVRYRLTAFGVSYITPGPQVGGEVLQVYYPSSLHEVSVPVALAATSVDKTLELVGNFTFLAIGSFVVLIGQRMISEADALALAALSLLLLIPVAIIVRIWRGRHPISGFVQWVRDHLPHRHRAQLRQAPGLRSLPQLARVQQALSHSEDAIASLYHTRPWTLIAAVLMTFAAWGMILANFWLLTQALALGLAPAQAVATLILVYFSFLLPVPGGLGAMEAALVVALASFGHPDEQALSLGLIMRARDLTITLIGLALGGAYLRRFRAGAGEPTAAPDAKGSANAPE